MVEQLIASLEGPISRVRLESYRDNGDDLDMVVNYFHNLELSEALYPSLQAFEVTFRNSLHDALTRHFETPYWFDTDIFQGDARANRQKHSISDARKSLSRDGKAEPYSSDHIVSRLNLGFWHGMFNKPFEDGLWRPNRAQLLTDVFPYVPKRFRSRQGVWDRIDRIRIIRNRVMHYEPILSRRSLFNDHRVVLDSIAWISPDMQATIAMCDRFPIVLGGGHDSVKQRIEAEIYQRYKSER